MNRRKRSPAKVSLALFLFALSFAQAQSLIIPQIADGGGWQTTLVVGNTTSVATTASIGFFQDIGSGATQNWNPSLIEGGSTQNLALPAGGTIFLHTTGTAAGTTAGWAQVQSAAGVVAYAIFTQRVSGRPDQDGTSPAAASVTRVLMPYDNTNNFVTSMAIVNTTSASESILVGIQPTSGTSSQPSPINLPAQGHMAFQVPQQFTGTVGQSGMLEFYVSGGSFSVLALRFNPTGSFTTAPVFPETGPPVIAAGSGTNVTGLWSGSATDVTHGNQMELLVLALSQTGSQVTGSFSTTGKALSSAPVSGSVAASTFAFSSAHFFDSQGCGAQFTGGTVQVTGATMQGSLMNVEDGCAADPNGAGTFPIQISLKAAVEQFCGTYSNPGADAGDFLILVSADGSVVASITPTNGIGSPEFFTGQATGSSITLTDSKGHVLTGFILNGNANLTAAGGGTFSASTTGCQ